MLGLHATDEWLEQFLACFLNNLSVVLTHWHIGMSQSVKQCMTVDLFPHILANVVDIQKEHLLLHTPVLNKTPGLSSQRMFVRLKRLRLIHCIYVSVTKSTCPAFSAWLNTGSIRSLKMTGKAIMLCSIALPPKLYAALHGQSNVGSMCDCKPCRS